MRCSNCHKEAQSDASFCPYCGAKLDLPSPAAHYEYSAFISYRHLPHDQEVAKRIQKAVESFKLPRGMSVQGRSDQRLGKCFRDEDELAASPSLPNRILDALEKSSSLIVVCSPDTRESIWVQREVEAFIGMHGRERIFTALASGSSSESIPDYLKTGQPTSIDSGKPGDTPNASSDDLANNTKMASTATGSHASPLSADLRPEASGKANDEMLRIIAAIAGCGFDDLRQRESVRRKRRFTGIAIAAVLAVILAVVMPTVAFQNYQNARMSDSYTLVKESENLLKQGDRYGAIEKALEALPDSSSPFARPYVEEARQALVEALEIDPIDNLYWRPSYSIELDNDDYRFIVEPDCNWFATLDNSLTVSTFDCKTGRKLASLSLLDLCEDESMRAIDSAPMNWTILPANERIIAREFSGSCITACFDARTGNFEWGFKDIPMRALAASPDGSFFDGVLLAGSSVGVFQLNAKDGTGNATSVTEAPGELSPLLLFSPADANDQGLMYAGVDNRIVAVDFSGENPSTTISDAKDFEVYTIRQVGNIAVASSYSKYASEEESSDGYNYEFCFEGLDQNLNTLWTHRDTQAKQLEGSGLKTYVADAGPQVCGTVIGDRTYAMCTVGDALLLLDSSTGEVSHSQRFGSAIADVEATELFDGEQEGPISVICVDGSVNLVNLAADDVRNLTWLGFSFPCKVYDAYVGWIEDGGFMAFAVSMDDPRQVYCYHFDLRAVLDLDTSHGSLARPINVSERLRETLLEQMDNPSSSYSLEELIEKAHDVLQQSGRK